MAILALLVDRESGGVPANRRRGTCPFCGTEQQLHLLADDKHEEYLRSILSLLTHRYRMLSALILNFYLIVVKDVPSTPTLRCTHCARAFFQCPFCEKTTLLPQETSSLEEVYCDKCKHRLALCGTWGV
jgi:hypothetical protein